MPISRSIRLALVEVVAGSFLKRSVGVLIAHSGREVGKEFGFGVFGVDLAAFERKSALFQLDVLLIGILQAVFETPRLSFFLSRNGSCCEEYSGGKGE